MNKLFIPSAIFISLAGPTFGDTPILDAGRALSETIFGTMDANPEGAVHLREFASFGSDIFFSMDTNTDEIVEFQEFVEWDFGFDFISEDAGETTAYETAQRVLFAYWDHNDDGTISRSEYERSLISDFRRADLDNDALLTRQEFLDGYIVIDTYRAAVVGITEQ